MRKWVAAVLSFSFLFNSSAAPVAAAKSFRPESVVQEVFDRAKGPEYLVFFSAFAGAKAEFLKKLRQDLNEAPGKAWPQLSIENHEIYLNKRSTGIWIDPKSPLRLAYRGNSWTYDPAQTLEKNYLSLQKFLNPAGKAAGRNPWINEAQAEWTNRDFSEIAGIALMIGVVIGGAAAVALTGGSAGILIPVILSVGLLGGVHAGMMIGDHVYEYNDVKKALGKVSSATEVEVKCDEKKSVVDMKMKDGKSTRLEFIRDGRTPSVIYSDGVSGHKSSISHVELPQYPYAQMMVCRNDQQAAKTAQGLRESIAELQKSEAPEKAVDKTAAEKRAGENTAQ